ncbi:Uncharacterised protein [Vibrio cholerae]|nr:Uncharacterised protein [Vibrio cholerae]
MRENIHSLPITNFVPDSRHDKKQFSPITQFSPISKRQLLPLSSIETPFKFAPLWIISWLLLPLT